MQKINQYVIFSVKDAKFFVQENIFKHTFMDDELVFLNSPARQQLLMSDICIRGNEIVKCRYDLMQIFMTFLSTLPNSMEDPVLPYRGWQIKLRYNEDWQSHQWEYIVIDKCGVLHKDPTSWNNEKSAILAARHFIDLTEEGKIENLR